MVESDYEKFGMAITALAELYGKTMSQGAIALWWQALERFSFEQVNKAIRLHTIDAESGQFMPKPADLIRILFGTNTEKSMIAWGKALEASRRIGAYSDIVFDDSVIHAVIEDIGGWPKFCRTDLKDIGYLQHRFCESYKAYSSRENIEFLSKLVGDRSSDDEFIKFGLCPPSPAFFGDEKMATAVYESGNKSGKYSINFIATVSKNYTKLIDSKQKSVA